MLNESEEENEELNKTIKDMEINHKREKSLSETEIVSIYLKWQESSPFFGIFKALNLILENSPIY